MALAQVGYCGYGDGESCQEDINRWGSDYHNFFPERPGRNPVDVCRIACESQAGCRAWTFVKRVGGQRARCWLKNSIPAGLGNRCCISGVPRRVFDPGIDRPGGDYENFELARPDPGLCQAACERHTNSRCKAWSYVAPGFHAGPKPRCYLKKFIMDARINPCCTSGVRYGRP